MSGLNVYLESRYQLQSPKKRYFEQLTLTLEPVVIVTTDGRFFSGVLEGYDNTTNVILSQTQERVITPDEPCEIIDLGIYIMRGEAVALCGLVEESLDKNIDWTSIRGSKLSSTKHQF